MMTRINSDQSSLSPLIIDFAILAVPMRTIRQPVAAVLLSCLALTGTVTAAQADPAPQGRTASFHAGLLYPNGVDVAGYTVERELRPGVYRYYTFGVPSLAAAGVAYYGNYGGNGVTATAGVGIGSVMYASLAYQIRVGEAHFVKLGGGVTTGIAYTGAYPVLSYEFRYQ